MNFGKDFAMRIFPENPPENPFALNSPLRSVFDRLVSRAPAPPLVPSGVWDAQIAQTLQKARAQNAAPDTVIAALHLLNDDLDAAHPLVQDDPSQTGSYLHYLVHRREGDWSNARYWAAQTGNHPVFVCLSHTFGTGTWSASALVSEMQEAARLPKNDPDYLSACALSARETAEATVWCAGAIQ